MSDPSLVSQLEPLPPEGFYRVTEPFHCCEKQCRRFEPEMLLELGYNGEGHAIAFIPELIDGMLAVPTSGTALDGRTLSKLKQLKIASASGDGVIH